MIETLHGFTVRPFQKGHEEGCYNVCLKTGDNGNDGTQLFTDPNILGHLYVGPYLKFEKDLSYVLTDEIEVCGYALAALDTLAFHKHFLNEWLPPLRAKYPMPHGPEALWDETEKCIAELHRPKTFYPESFHPFPSHLHIDLLPKAQGKGIGTRMMGILLDDLKQRGSAGVHLAMAETNDRAGYFYRKLGFHKLCQIPGDAIYMGRAFNG